MLRKVLILPVLCALAVAFPTLPPESTTDLPEWIPDLTLDGEEVKVQDSVADQDQTKEWIPDLTLDGEEVKVQDSVADQDQTTQWIPELTLDGEEVKVQDSVADQDQTTQWIPELILDGEEVKVQDSVADLDQTTDPESTTDSYLDVTQTSEFSTDLKTATATPVEEASEAPGDYDVFLYDIFANENF
ncbi:uncharacterized protein LOC144364937 isoform X2 [Ictidomys tridecemlineatus]